MAKHVLAVVTFALAVWFQDWGTVTAIAVLYGMWSFRRHTGREIWEV